MNRQEYNGRVGFPVFSILAIIACIFLVTPLVAVAEGSPDAVSENATGGGSGVVDGLNLQTRKIWISDYSYFLDRNVKVKGTPTKLGLLTDLKKGEKIRFLYRPNERRPSIPFITFIERM